MTNLTEQWKKGKLEQGWYYVKGADGLFGMMSDYALYRVNLEHPDNTISLLAKVQSYSEWQAKDKENQQLKELLKKCRLAIFDYPPYNSASDKIRLKNKIDEVLK